MILAANSLSICCFIRLTIGHERALVVIVKGSLKTNQKYVVNVFNRSIYSQLNSMAVRESKHEGDSGLSGETMITLPEACTSVNVGKQTSNDMTMWIEGRSTNSKRPLLQGSLFEPLTDQLNNSNLSLTEEQ